MANCVYNSGSFCADNVDPPSPWTQGELETGLSFNEQIVLVQYTADEVLRILEHSVSMYPLYAGRFLQVSKGIHFEFDPRKPAGSRIDRSCVRVCNDSLESVPLSDGVKYTFAMNAYMTGGGGGYFTPEEDVLEKLSFTGPELVAAYLEHAKKDIDGDGIPDLARLSPKQEGRIICLYPNSELVRQYPYSL